MAQQAQKYRTLYISNPNGGQRQIVKIPAGDGSAGTVVKAAVVKAAVASTDQLGKLQSRQIITIPVNQKINLQTLKGVVPIEIKPQQLQISGAPASVAIPSNVSTSATVVPQSKASVTGFTPIVPTLSAIRPKIQPPQKVVGQSQEPHITCIPEIPIKSDFSNSATPPRSLITTPILDHTGARKRHDFDIDYNVESKRRKTEKGGKGLRHFSTKVCEKVQAKGTTSYNEVADELVNEMIDPLRCNSPSEGASYDQKNIRRRVYDALNVLMAMNIISKEKKEIKWLGLPTNSAQECHKLEMERAKRIESIKLKTQQLQDLILQQIAFKNLVERNRREEMKVGSPSPNSAIQLPFIIVNTSKKTVIDCSISNDKSEYLFNFDNTFEIHDDIEVLKRMGMALGLEKKECTEVNLQKAKSMVPKALESYVDDLATGVQQPQFLADFDSSEVKRELCQRISDRGKNSSTLRPVSVGRAESASPSSYGDELEEEEEDIESDVDIN